MKSDKVVLGGEGVGERIRRTVHLWGCQQGEWGERKMTSSITEDPGKDRDAGKSQSAVIVS